MGVDDIKTDLERKKAEAERKLAVTAGKAAVKTAWKGLVAAVSGLADDVLSKGERELSEARASRGIADEKAAVEDDISTSESALGRVRESTASLPTPSARDRRLARERRALEQLQALKSARAAGPPEQPAEPSHDPLDDRPRPRTLSTGERERRDGEERAQRELDSLKEQQGHPEDRPPVKRTL